MRGVQSLFLISLALMAVFFDLKEERIPNFLILIGFWLGFFQQIDRFGWVGVVLFLGGAALPIVLSVPIYYFRMIGGGDIKLFAVVGGFLGVYKVFVCILFSFLIGGILSLCLILQRRNLQERMKYFVLYLHRRQMGIWEPYLNEKDRGGRIHFTIAILGAILLYAGGMY